MFLGAVTGFGNQFHRLKQFPLGAFRCGFLATGIQPSAVLQFIVGIIAKKVWRTDGAVSLGDAFKLERMASTK